MSRKHTLLILTSWLARCIQEGLVSLGMKELVVYMADVQGMVARPECY